MSEIAARWSRIEALVAEAENAFRRAPKAIWSDRTYLAPKDAAVLRALIEAHGLSAQDTSARLDLARDEIEKQS